jgi:phosphoglycolate phosphatase-like HAD superfamily hydrolase/membrane protease YdiL (CAAX protease family)
LVIETNFSTELNLKPLAKIFWNPTERRFRSAWRIIGQQILWLLLMVLIYPLFSISSETLQEFHLLELAAVGGTGLALIGSIFIAARFLDKRHLMELGLKLSPRWWADLGLGLGLGALLMGLLFSLEFSLGWIEIEGFFVLESKESPIAGRILFALVFFILVGIYEELFSRGYLIKNLSEGLSGTRIGPRLGIALATLLSSISFGLMHAFNPNATYLGILNICLAGFLLAAGYVITGQLAIPIGLHISWNFFQGPIFGFPVSGSVYQSEGVFRILQGGPELWTGGAFGPEGGLLGSLFILLGIGMIWFWKGSGKGIDLSLGHYKPRKRITEKDSPLPPSGLDGVEGIQHIIWDWNGTLLDDLEICLEIINNMLAARKLGSLSRNSYTHVFDFPVKDYYEKIGFDFEIEPFQVLSDEFIAAYEKGRPDCGLLEGVREILDFTAGLGISQSILSASKEEYLKIAVDEYQIADYFTVIQGLDNHNAAGKLDLAREFMASCAIPPSQILMVGDTTHDSAIASELGVNCILIPNGHHSRPRLENTNYPVLDSLEDLKAILQPGS